MLAAELSCDEAKAELASNGSIAEAVQIACFNGPKSVTFSGTRNAVEALGATLRSRGTFARLLNTGGNAYHSRHMRAVAQSYEDLLTPQFEEARQPPIAPTSPKMMSTITGKAVTNHDTHRASYWRSNLEMPVLFETGVTNLSADCDYHWIEVGPHRALQTIITQIHGQRHQAGSKMLYSSLLVRKQDSSKSTLSVMGKLFQNGHSIDFAKINSITPPGTVGTHETARLLPDLPTYPWDHENFLWNETRLSSDGRWRMRSSHELLGHQVPGGDGRTYTWRNVLRKHDVSWLKDHRLGPSIIFPSAGYMTMAIEALRHIGDGAIKSSRTASTILMRNVNFLKVLNLSEVSDFVEVYIHLSKRAYSASTTSSVWWTFEIVSFYEGTSTTHSTGLIKIQTQNDNPLTPFLQQKTEVRMDKSEPWYKRFEKVGLFFGPSFRTLDDVSFPSTQKSSTVRCTALPRHGEAAAREEDYLVHPVTIDAVLQACLLSTSAGEPLSLRCKVPVHVANVELDVANAQRAVGPWSIHARAQRVGMQTFRMDGQLFDQQENIVFKFERLRAPGYLLSRLRTEQADRKPMIHKAWVSDPFYDCSPQLDAVEVHLNNQGKKSGKHLENGSCSPQDDLAIPIRQCHPHANILRFDGSTKELANRPKESLNSDVEHNAIVQSTLPVSPSVALPKPKMTNNKLAESF